MMSTVPVSLQRSAFIVLNSSSAALLDSLFEHPARINPNDRRPDKLSRHSFQYLAPRENASGESEQPATILAEIAPVENQAGKEEEKCRVGPSVGHNQQ